MALKLKLGVLANPLTFCAHDFAELVVDPYRVLRGLIDQLYPSALIFGWTGLGHQIRCLNDGFEGVAEVVRKSAKLTGDFGGDFVIGCHRWLVVVLRLRRSAFVSLQPSASAK